jgi:arsenate reductase
MSLKIYEYAKCNTCRNALKFLDAKKIKYEKLPIVEQPPTLNELKKMLKQLKARGKTFKQLFNTSGEVYRELKIGDKIKAGMSEEQALKLLAQNGKLIKRPFAISATDGIVGFNEVDWANFIKN